MQREAEIEMDILKKRKKEKISSARNENFLLTEKAPFAMQEAYKTLRTNVMLSLPGSDSKCLGITSACPGEGKSTTATNLAIALAQIGKRVLLVDCDLRLPTVAAKFRIPAVPGLSDFLAGQARIEDAVRLHETFGIHILPAGTIPPDPTGLLESAQMGHLIAALKKIYDYVIVDLPPATTVSDAAILTKYIDGYLLVTHIEHTEHRKINEMLRQMQMAGANILGFVTTGGAASGSYYYYKR